MQLGLNAEAWPEGATLPVRMGLHTGEVRVRGGDDVDYSPMNRCARVKAAAHGGQVLLTRPPATWWQGAWAVALA